MFKKEALTYEIEGKKFEGEFLFPQGEMPHPCILLFHAWKGKDSFIKSRAEEIVQTLGVATFCCDLYGEGMVLDSDEEAGQQMMPLFIDRKTLRQRVIASYEAAISHPLVHKNKVGAIGFCFGGLAAIELVRAGAPIQGACTFHAVLSDTLGGEVAKKEPIAKDIRASLLVLHGFLDPMCQAKDLLAFEEEMKEAGIDWQLHTYGLAYHAFTNPAANDRENGLLYNQKAAKRAFQAMGNFFYELF